LEPVNLIHLTYSLKANLNKLRNIICKSVYFNLAMVLVFLLFLLLLPSAVNGQNERGRNLIQLSGVVRNELLESVPVVIISIKSKKRGTLGDESGLFSIVAEKRDKVVFASLGYKKTGFIIPDTITSHFLSTDIILFADTVRLKVVHIYPWKTYEEFKQAFLALKLPTTDADRARKNIEIIQRQIFESLAPDSRIAYQNTMMDNFNRMATRGQTPVNNLLNPFSWAKFFKALKEGKLKSHPDKSSNE
jgi:hypothetical protein